MHQINDPEQLKKVILTLTEQYYAAAFPKETFEAGETLIPVSMKLGCTFSACMRADASELSAPIDP